MNFKTKRARFTVFENKAPQIQCFEAKVRQIHGFQNRARQIHEFWKQSAPDSPQNSLTRFGIFEKGVSLWMIQETEKGSFNTLTSYFFYIFSYFLALKSAIIAQKNLKKN